MNYDAANYDFYEAQSAEYLVLSALHAHTTGVEQVVQDLLPERVELVRHAASGCLAWRAVMTRERLHAVRDGLARCGAVVRREDVTPWPRDPLSIALFVTRQDRSPRAVLEWCKANPKLARVDAVVSTTSALEPLAREYGVRFFIGGEARLHAPDFFASIGLRPDLLVLARYMRILPPDLVARFPDRIINVHHALLPAFIGANTYERAMERGVRVMGATAHYVTDALDEGPIICQKAFEVDHGWTLDQIKAHGATHEAAALRNAVAAHARRCTLPVGRHVVRFDCSVASAMDASAA